MTQNPDQFKQNFFDEPRRASLTPISDLGGDKSAANAAIAEFKAESAAKAAAEPEAGQMDLFSAAAEIAPTEELKVRRAKLGSLALTPEQMATMPAPQIEVDRPGYQNSEYSAGANQRQQEADRAVIRRQTRGRGPGR